MRCITRCSIRGSNKNIFSVEEGFRGTNDLPFETGVELVETDRMAWVA
jgi:hypothetical protein